MVSGGSGAAARCRSLMSVPINSVFAGSGVCPSAGPIFKITVPGGRGWSGTINWGNSGLLNVAAELTHQTYIINCYVACGEIITRVTVANSAINHGLKA